MREFATRLLALSHAASLHVWPIPPSLAPRIQVPFHNAKQVELWDLLRGKVDRLADLVTQVERYRAAPALGPASVYIAREAMFAALDALNGGEA